MNAGRLKWFIALSVAVHAMVLIAWTPDDMEAGNPGRVINMDMIEITGTTTTKAAASIPGMAPGTQEPDTKTAKTAEPTTVPHDEEPETGDTETGDRVAAGSPAETREPSPATVASSTQPSRQESDRHLRNSLLELVATNLKYPPVARRKGWQGTVVLKLHIESNGRISRLQVSETSGYPVLDRAAVDSLQLASVVQADQWLNGKSVDIVLPVEYRLVDS